MSADKVKFRKPVLPGDTLFIEGEVLKVRGSIGMASCRCYVNDQVVSEGELKFALLANEVSPKVQQGSQPAIHSYCGSPAMIV